MRLRFAVSAAARMRGMLGAGVAAQQGEEIFLIAPCRRVHTMGMSFALDVAYIAADGRVLRATRGLKPGRVPAACPSAVAVLERRASAGAWLSPGQFVELGIRSRGQSPAQKGVAYETLSDLRGACG
ncbi:MAG: DUF192 domain-containing protein [Actinomycetia bacterium]|nr:DUF192 domain-containing protein [Actinomycetes bacterium]